MSTNCRTAPGTIVVLGADLVGHVAAIALKRALPDCDVTLSTLRAAAPGVEEASLVLPTAINALGCIGLDEGMIVRANCASHRLCEEFEGWRDGRFAIEAAERTRLCGSALHQLWLMHGTMPFEALSPAIACARTGHFAPGGGMFEPALAIDETSMHLQLVGLARRCGVTYGEAVNVQPSTAPEDEDRMTVIFADGRAVIPHLVVDAGAMLPRSGGRTLSAYRRIRPGKPALCDRYALNADGWYARWCGPHGDTEVMVPADDRSLPPAEVGAWHRVDYRIRRPETPMAGNRVCLVATPGPFLRLGLSASFQLVALLLDLLPARRPEPLLANEYNRRARRIINDAFDFTAAFGTAAHPVAKAFGQTGRLPPGVGEFVGPPSWQALLIGLGVRAKRPDALSGSVLASEAKAALFRFQHNVAKLPAQMPPYAQWLNSVVTE